MWSSTGGSSIGAEAAGSGKGVVDITTPSSSVGASMALDAWLPAVLAASKEASMAPSSLVTMCRFDILFRAEGPLRRRKIAVEQRPYFEGEKTPNTALSARNETTSLECRRSL